MLTQLCLTQCVPAGGAGLINLFSWVFLDMARVWQILLTTIVLIALCLYLLLQLILQQNAQPASLNGYPDRHAIEDLLRKAQNESSLLFHPPLHTHGRYVLDNSNRRFKLISINWYGASDTYQIPGGLNVQHRDDIAKTIRKMGFNSVRLPYADQMVRDNPLIPSPQLAANADLVGQRALDIFHAVVESLTNAGLAVIINNHITQARWCCDLNPCDAQWFNSFLGPFCPVSQTENNWIENWLTVMRPHILNPLVVGVDLRNEVRGLSGKYLWSDWAVAAERAAERLLLLQPNWLVVIEGVSSANDVSGARDHPIELSVPNRVVYSAHVYGWSGWGSLSTYWRRKYESFYNDMQKNWAYLLDEDIAPVWVGEFGAPDEPNEGDLHYWEMLMKYMKVKDADLGYWALNPRKPTNDEFESYGLVDDDWMTVRADYRLYDIMGLARQRSGLPLVVQQK